MKKKTEDLMNEIVESKDISQYLNANPNEFINTPLHAYLRELLQHTQLKVSQVADASYKGEYIYKVFRGIKNPSRNVLLSIALAMRLGLDKTRTLLRIAQVASLDARNRRDSIIIFALNRGMAVPDANDILYQYHEECL